MGKLSTWEDCKYFYMFDTFISVFEKNIDKPAILYKEELYSYNDLLNFIYSWGQFLITKEILPGEIVAVQADFTPNAIGLIFALINNKNIIVPLDVNSIANNNNKLNISGAKYVFSFFENDDYELEIKKEVINHVFFDELVARNTPGIVLFSSGSSGEPKAAVHDLNKLLIKFNSKRIALRTLNFLLFDHWGGLNTMFHILSSGGLVITCKDRSPNFVCKLIEKYKIELLPASPTFLKLLLLSDVYQNLNLDSLQIITYGTEPMPESTLIKLKSVFPNIKLLQTYGLIELGVMQTKSKSNDSLWVKIGGEGYDYRVINGLLEIKADSAMLGYLNSESPFTADGWFKTNDVVEVDGEFLKILGRKSELINVGGDKVFPQEIENVILELNYVKDVLVYGEPNSIIGNIVCAKIRLVDDETLYCKDKVIDIKNHCKSKLSKFKVPVKIQITTEDLVNSRFKKDRNSIR